MTLSPISSSPVFTVRSQRKPGQPVHFGHQQPNNGRIDNDVYALLSAKVPKTELHVHQGGSSSVEFLSFCLRQAIQKNQQIYEQWISSQLPTANNRRAAQAQVMPENLQEQLLKELPIFQKDAPAQIVPLVDKTGKPLPPEQLRAAMAKVLTMENVRQYHRYNLLGNKFYEDSRELAETTATPQPLDKPDEMVTHENAAKRVQDGLNAYRATSSLKINPHVKNLAAMYLVANRFAYEMENEKVRYAEYRVSPLGNGVSGSNIDDVLLSVQQGLEDARQNLNQRNRKFDYGLIVLIERQNRSKDEPANAKVERAVQLMQDVVRLKKEGKYNIVGVDLAGDEANNPVTDFKPAFKIITDYNKSVPPEKRLGITIHSGETKASGNLTGPQSIQASVDMGANRLGHGLQLLNSSPAMLEGYYTYLKHKDEKDWDRHIDKEKILKNSPLLREIIEKGITVEMCPKSNLQTYGIDPAYPEVNGPYSVKRSEYSAAAYSRHPAVFLSRLGVKVAISSDNRTISNTDSTNEFVKLYKYAGLKWDDLKKMTMNGFEGAFIADPKKKAAIINEAKQQFDRLEHDPNAKRAIELMGGKSKVGKASEVNKTTPVAKPWARFKTGFTQQMHAIRDGFKQMWQSIKDFFARLFNQKK
jgi:adenosine deaminase